MESKNKKTHEKDNLYPFASGRFKSSDFQFIFFSILTIFAIGFWFNSINYYFTVYNLVFSLIALFAIFLMGKFIKKAIYFWILNLILPVFIGVIFFNLYGVVDGFNILLLMFSMAAFSLISLIKILEDPIAIEKERTDSVKKIIEVCLQSEGFGLLLVLNSWLIFFTMFQSWLFMMDCNDEGALFFVIYGAIIVFVFSLPVVLIGIILSLRTVAKSLSVMIRFSFYQRLLSYYG